MGELARGFDREWDPSDGDALQDPFSDVSLFLAGKVRTEVQKHGGTKGWSSRIQSELLEKILPEFRQAFPKTRLGTSTLKRVWDKVSLFYGKLQGEEALRGDGKLDIEYVIRENLRRKEATYLPDSLPPYHYAHRVALKVGEYIATLEGTKPRTHALTKLIWSVQKHLITDLPARKAKSAYEEYDTLDKFIVKTMLEVSSSEKCKTQAEIAGEITRRLTAEKSTYEMHSEEHLYSLCAQSLAKARSCNIVSQLKPFIAMQRNLCHAGEPNTDAADIETAQRVLALYPLLTSLPKNASETLKQSITHIYKTLYGEECELDTPIDHATYTFINAEIHFLSRKEGFETYEQIEEIILKTISLSKNLPKWSEDLTEILEIACWQLIDDTEKNPVIERTLGNIIIEAPHISFQTAIYQTLHTLRSVADHLALNDRYFDKLEMWTMQNDMATRWIHFDTTSPLATLIATTWKKLKLKETTVCHKAFIETILQNFLAKNPSLSPYQSLLREKITILYKHLWYHTFTAPEESTYDRFCKWHTAAQKKKSLPTKLQEITSALLPLLPPIG